MSQHSADQSGFPFDRPIHPETGPAQPQRGQLPRFRLVLHHDVERELMYTVRTIMELTRLGRAEATHKMWESYHNGRSVLLITYKERAELYVEQFAAKRLTVSIEPQG